MHRRRTKLAGALLAGTILLAACGGGEEESAPAAQGGSAKEGLAGVCPDPVVLQTDWFPEPEHGGAYQLIGPGGEIDKEKGTYTGEIGDTGVNLEIRSGGPFIGFQQDSAQMYQDEEILLGYVNTDEGVQNSARLPTKAILAPLEISPQILMWDPETYDFSSFEDIGKSDATVLYFEGGVFMDYLVGAGFIREEQIDGSYDGSPARFVSEGDIVQQGFATNEPYKFENDIKEWGRPVDYLLIHDSGYEFYTQTISVKPDDLESERDCLELLVPIMQQAQVDYIKNPGPVNEELLKIVEELDTFWTLSEGGNKYAVAQMKELEVVSNGPNQTLGDFDMDRTQAVVDLLNPIFEEKGVRTWDPEVTAEDIVTNEFIDQSIGL